MTTEKIQPLAQEGYNLMAAAFAVHQEIGGGLHEEVYQESLELELAFRSIPYQARQELAIHYKGFELKKRYLPDLYVCDHIIVELKAVSELLAAHEAQLLNYMRLSRSPVGYLINFGPMAKVEWKRFVLTEFITNQTPMGNR